MIGEPSTTAEFEILDVHYDSFRDLCCVAVSFNAEAAAEKLVKNILWGDHPGTLHKKSTLPFRIQAGYGAFILPRTGENCSAGFFTDSEDDALHYLRLFAREDGNVKSNDDNVQSAFMFASSFDTNISLDQAEQVYAFEKALIGCAAPELFDHIEEDEALALVNQIEADYGIKISKVRFDTGEIIRRQGATTLAFYAGKEDLLCFANAIKENKGVCAAEKFGWVDLLNTSGEIIGTKTAAPLCKFVVLHEMAHALVKHLSDGGAYPLHGPVFIMVYSQLLHRYGGIDPTFTASVAKNFGVIPVDTNYPCLKVFG
ncbi:MAG: hypothetical protein GC136_01645 [Alphaproteobacteria bacterium]|nr:hypothetical protein [Alphaproteobacteria bacterium]